jgi:hypothetical protein
MFHYDRCFAYNHESTWSCHKTEPHLSLHVEPLHEWSEFPSCMTISTNLPHFIMAILNWSLRIYQFQIDQYSSHFTLINEIISRCFQFGCLAFWEGSKDFDYCSFSSKMSFTTFFLAWPLTLPSCCIDSCSWRESCTYSFEEFQKPLIKTSKILKIIAIEGVWSTYVLHLCVV